MTRIFCGLATACLIVAWSAGAVAAELNEKTLLGTWKMSYVVKPNQSPEEAKAFEASINAVKNATMLVTYKDDGTATLILQPNIPNAPVQVQPIQTPCTWKLVEVNAEKQVIKVEQNFMYCFPRGNTDAAYLYFEDGNRFVELPALPDENKVKDVVEALPFKAVYTRVKKGAGPKIAAPKDPSAKKGAAKKAGSKNKGN